jgi:hypothetical protein
MYEGEYVNTTYAETAVPEPSIVVLLAVGAVFLIVGGTRHLPRGSEDSGCVPSGAVRADWRKLAGPRNAFSPLLGAHSGSKRWRPTTSNPDKIRLLPNSDAPRRSTRFAPLRIFRQSTPVQKSQG